MAKARHVRKVQGRGPDGQQAEPAGGVPTGSPTEDSVSTRGALSASGWGSYGANTPGVGPAIVFDAAGGVGVDQGNLGAEADDPLLDMWGLPDDLYMGDVSTFGVSGNSACFSLGMMGAGSAIDGWDGSLW